MKTDQTFTERLRSWENNPDVVLLETLRVGDCFKAYDGKIYRITGWYKGRVGECPLVVCLADGSRTMFAGRASGVPVKENAR
jgi:hypothetical protein